MNASGVELDVIVTAKISMPHGYAYRASGNPVKRILTGISPFGETLDAPCIAYAVRHPSAGTILIDTGMHQDAAKDPRRDFGLPLSLMFRGLRPAEEPFDEQLRALDIEPGAVEQVVMTHLHVNHTSGMRLLPNAKFTASGAEWAATRGRFPAGKAICAVPPACRLADAVAGLRPQRRASSMRRSSRRSTYSAMARSA